MKRMFVLAVLVASPAFAEPVNQPFSAPRDLMIPTNDPTEPPGTLSYNVLYLNNCKPSGCTVKGGTTDNRTDTSSIAGGHLTPWTYSDADWTSFVDCVKDVLYPYNVTVTDVDPGMAAHAEIMVAGQPTDIGLPNSVGGVSPYAQTCFPIANPLVFDFASVWTQNGTTPLIEEICATAIQEISHSYVLDHVTDASDPMTYFQFTGRRYLHDNVQCGSDCTLNGNFCNPGTSGCVSPTGLQCTTAQTHTCYCSNSSTQNDAMTWLADFGPGPEPGPTVQITKPSPGQALMPGFVVQANVTQDIGVTGAELDIDGMKIASASAPPYVWNTPTSLAAGNHKITVIGSNHYMKTGMATVTAYIGAPCMKDSDCPDSTEVCIDQKCVLGPGQPGGLGATCTDNTMCDSGNCQNDGTSMHCVDDCMVGQCPSGYGCLTSNGATMGVCWPGFNDGSGGGGCCETGHQSPTGALVLGLGVAGMFLFRRRRS